MKLADLKSGGHAPSLFSAFLHFDISFMVWVMLGALMPFIASDPALTGVNLRITPTPTVRRFGQYTLIVKEQTANSQNAGNWRGVKGHGYILLIKPGDPSTATRASVKPVEKFVLDNADPSSVALVNARSRFIRIAIAPQANGNPNENVLALKPETQLAEEGKTFQALANGYPNSIKLLLIGVPLLAAAFWRILLGVLADRFGSKRIGTASLIVTLLPLVVGWQFATSYNSLWFVGFFLGLAGASFAVSLPLASRWYPPHLQGLAMGIAGAGNSGTVAATLIAPLLAKVYGWHAVLGLLTVPVCITLAIFALIAKDPPGQTRPARVADYISVLTQSDTWWFCLLYFVTFGGFVGLASFFNTFFVDQYDAPKAAVGLWTWPFIVAGSLLRPVGGALADRLGGIKMLTLLYAVVVACCFGVGVFITNFSVACALLFVLMACLGMGNGSVFQLVPQRFKKQIGVMTGLVGAAGGVGGYYLNFVLGHLYDVTKTYATGFFAFGAIAIVALVALRSVAPAWTRTWLGTNGVARSGTAKLSPQEQPVRQAEPVS